ncbi:MAG TPA: hypothetical protein VKS22_16725 [Candidatus Binataceae bacterium]|nr:hypothetical protein [Candidatus Binataceae bacterium]
MTPLEYPALGGCDLGSVARLARFTTVIGALSAELSAPHSAISRAELLELRRILDSFARLTTGLRAAVHERVHAIGGGFHYVG